MEECLYNYVINILNQLIQIKFLQLIIHGQIFEKTTLCFAWNKFNNFIKNNVKKKYFKNYL